jgi:uncharacterized membrane protein YjjP (DUF1212 family)
MINQDPVDASEWGQVFLKAGIFLLDAGASSGRIITNVSRMAAAYGYEAHVNLSTRYISITLQTQSGDIHFTGSRAMTGLPGVNFKVIAAISQLSWDVTQRPLTPYELNLELDNILKLPRYNRALILGLVGMAGVSFCYNFGGDTMEMAITFIATVAGLFLKQELTHRKFNPYLVTYFSAALAALIIGVCWKFEIGDRLDHAFATSTLFLIPGVPLINSIMDLIDGYIINGVDRGINGSIHAFAIAAGLATILHLFQFPT